MILWTPALLLAFFIMAKRTYLQPWDKFNMLTVVIKDWVKYKNTAYLCKCDCGNETIAVWYQLKWWWKMSCWCLSTMKGNPNKMTHWLSNTKIQDVYYNIIKRCGDEKNNRYRYYGWRGIKCEWKSFENFLDDMYDSYIKHCKQYWKRNTTIDRIDVDWNYCKENCRRATYKEQAINKTDSVYHTINWVTKTQWERLSEIWLSDWAFGSRIRRLRNIEDALLTPPLKLWENRKRLEIKWETIKDRQ